MRLQTTSSNLELAKEGTVYSLNLSSDWTHQRWFAVYFFSESSSLGGFGAYIPNLLDQSIIH